MLLVVCLLGAKSYAGGVLDGKMPEDLMPELREVIASALENSNAMLDREYIEREADGRRIVSRSVMLPSFASNIAFRQEKDEDDADKEGFEERTVYNVALTQPLYHWGALRSEKQIGDLQYEIEKLNTRNSVSSVVAKVRRDYMRLVIAKQKLDRSGIDLEEAEDKLEFQLGQVEAGIASEVSILPYRLAVQREELAQLKELGDWEYQLAELASYVSMDPVRIESLLVDEIPEIESLESALSQTLEAYYDTALENDDDLRKLGLDIEIERRRLKIQDKSLRPKVNAQLGLSSNALDLDGTRREQSYSYFGLSVAWRIFDGFQKKGRTQETLSRLTRKERAKSLAVESKVRRYDYLGTRLEIAGRALAIEERVLESVSGRLEWITKSVEEGSLPATDLDKARKDFDATLLKTQSARIDYLSALSEFAIELGFGSSN